MKLSVDGSSAGCVGRRLYEVHWLGHQSCFADDWICFIPLFQRQLCQYCPSRSGLAFSPPTSFASGLLSSPILAMSPFTALSKSSVNSVAQAFKTHSRAKAGLQPTKHSLKTRGLEPAPEESWQAPGHVPPTPSPALPYARPSGQPSPPQQQPRKRSGWLAQSLLPGCSWPGAPADVPWSPE